MGEDWADMREDDVYFPPLSGNEGASDADSDGASINHLSLITASHAELHQIQALNRQLLEEEVDESQPVPTVPIDYSDLQHGEFEPTLDVEAEILRDQVYEEVAREARREEEPASMADINAAASYDYMQSTVMLCLPGSKRLKKALMDSGAHIDLIRMDQVPNGSVTKQLKRPLHIAGYDGKTAERVSTMVRLKLQTEDGGEFQPRWYHVVNKCNYDIILSKDWMNQHECHWQMSSKRDDISLLSSNRGRIAMEAKKVEEVKPSVSVVQPRKLLSANKVLNEEVDGDVVGRLLLTEDLEVQARMGEVPELKVRFVKEPCVQD
jgi:hypothetical protein